jgi:hypothetical protein
MIWAVFGSSMFAYCSRTSVGFFAQRRRLSSSQSDSKAATPSAEGLLKAVTLARTNQGYEVLSFRQHHFHALAGSRQGRDSRNQLATFKMAAQGLKKGSRDAEAATTENDR